MATRCAIIGKVSPKRYNVITCHYDGYPLITGLILHYFYNTPHRVKSLLELGNLELIGARVDPTEKEKTQYLSGESEIPGWVPLRCTAYIRDWKEDAGPNLYPASIVARLLWDKFRNVPSIEYVYFLEDHNQGWIFWDKTRGNVSSVKKHLVASNYNPDFIPPD